jgi:predicted lipid-binding transport protein (Tim44 family)
MAADLIIYAIVAAALVFWLKSLLGTRNGEERDRPNPFNPKEPANQQDPINIPASFDETPRVVDMPMRVTKTTLVNRVKIETPNAESGLRTIASADPRFNLDRFMEGAENAFEIIVMSFAKGDRATIRPLLAPNVYNDFDRAITDRATRSETCDTHIEAINRMDIISAQLRGQTAFITIRFNVMENCIVRNAAGAIIGGELNKATQMVDLWTFGRDLTSNSPIWLLYETRDEHAEYHKTPIPESGI